jgi:hypothetical protein
MRGLGPNQQDEEPADIIPESKLGTFAAFKPTGPHDDARTLLISIGMHKHWNKFRKYSLRSVALLRSMIALSHFIPTLESMGVENKDDLMKIQKAVMDDRSLVVDPEAMAAADAAEDEEDEPEPEPEPHNPHLVKLSKKEYDEILDWSDDEDTTTPRGRFNRRQKKQRGCAASTAAARPTALPVPHGCACALPTAWTPAAHTAARDACAPSAGRRRTTCSS